VFSWTMIHHLQMGQKWTFTSKKRPAAKISCGPVRMLIAKSLSDAATTYVAQSCRTSRCLASSRGSHADTVNAVHTGTAGFTDIGDETVRLLNRGDRHCLCRECNSYDESNRDQFFHAFLPFMLCNTLAMRSSERPQPKPAFG